MIWHFYAVALNLLIIEIVSQFCHFFQYLDSQLGKRSVFTEQYGIRKKKKKRQMVKEEQFLDIAGQFLLQENDFLP